MREDDSLGLTRGARGRDHEGVAVGDGPAVGQRVLLAVGGDDTGRAQRVEHDPARRAGQPRVEGSSGVTGVPDGAQRVDEPNPAGEVECDELGHRPVA